MTGPFRYTSPQPPKAATGAVADVYAQLAGDFGTERAPTFVVLSASPALLAATWALLRESLLAGQVPRTDKEVVAAGVSLANRCPFCVDAHTMLLHANGDHRLAETIARGGQPDEPALRELLSWGKDLSSPQPFEPAVAAELIGTALAFHFINRIVSALLTENLLPCGLQKVRAVRSAAGRTLARTVRRERETGLSLPLLRTRGEEPAWAAGTAVGTAFGALRTAAEQGAGLLSDEDAAWVRASVAAWDGVTPLPLHGAGLPDRAERPGARLALLAARAPYRITDEDVAAWFTPPSTDDRLVHLIAFGAICAIGRVEATLTPRTKEHA